VKEDRRVFQERLRFVSSSLPRCSESGVDALVLVCQDGVGWEDIYYLTGFPGTSGVLVITRDDSLLFVDPRYIEMAGETCCRGLAPRATRERQASPLRAALDCLSRRGARAVGYNRRRIGHCAYAEMAGAFAGGARLVDLSSLLVGMRRRKSASEEAHIRDAVRIASEAFLETLSESSAGMSERDFACLMEYWMRAKGEDFANPLPIMVSSGERTAMPHAVPSDRRFDWGDLVMVDFCARSGGYVCDITRMFSVGEPSGETLSLYSLVRWAQAEAASLIAPGRLACELDLASRGVMAGAGLGDFFTHGVGHGFGLSVHEMPSISDSARYPLAEGDAITLEPGFYRPGWGGMRVEDDYLVTASGGVCLTGALSGELRVIER
jgi:Xaa-Pro aminopeptidase